MTDLRGFFKPNNSKFKSTYRAKKKKLKKGKNRDNYQKRRLLVLEHFILNEYATNVGVCFCIHNETGWSIPGSAKQYPRFISRYSKQLNRDSKRSYRKKWTTSEEFYNSKQWKELRYTALSLSEGKCNLCGATAHDGVQIHVDHIKPRSKHPELELDLDNLQVLCGDCNYGKSNYDDMDFRNRL